MPRQIVTIKQLAQRTEFPWTEWQIRDLIKRNDCPLPHKKCGKSYLFDLERIWHWFDGLPGRDETI